MAARAIWKGVIHIGPMEVPVKLYSAVQDKSVHFRLLHAKDHAPVSQQMVSSETGKPVPKEEVRKAYPLDSTRLVKLEKDELESIEPKSSREIDVVRFVNPAEIDHRWYERAYYLGPDGSEEAYFAAAEAIGRKGLEGLARWVMRKKSYVGALRAEEGYLMLISLRHAEEVVAASSLEPPEGRNLDKREIAMGAQLVNALAGEFDPAEFEDTYRRRVMELVETKGSGGTVKLKAFKPKKTDEDALSAALEASLAGVAGSKGKKAARGR